MELVADNPTTESTKSTAVPACLHVMSYPFHYKRYVNDLIRKLNDLNKVLNDLNGDITLAKDNGENIPEAIAVQRWIEKVEKVRKKFEGSGFGRYYLATSKKKKEIIDELLVEGKNFLTYVLPRVPEYFEVLASREPTIIQVMLALEDKNTNLVGVYGMGGVGKTILVKQVREKVETTKQFYKIVLAKVSQDPDITGIQSQIAESLGIRLEEEGSITERANKLSDHLTQFARQNKKVLIILDDLWKKLELAEVGVIVGEFCKVLVTSRNLNVCRSMETSKDIQVNILLEGDSFELFRQEVGDLDSNSHCEISKKIVKECAGLPLAIITLARFLRGNDNDVWEAVLHLLNKSMFKDMDLVNTSIKLSYDFLEANETKLCFLLCALFPKGYNVTMDMMLGYAMGEDVLGNAKTLEEARRKLHKIVVVLVSCGLLLNDDGERCIIMHPIFRDIAVSIAHEESNKSNIIVGLGLKQWPKLKLGSSLRMSLMCNDIRMVPDSPGCSQLVTLSLASNPLKKISHEFFKNMQCLATLDMSKTCIVSLPQSLSYLHNCLRSLYLDDCSSLKDLSGIGNLHKLEILSIQGSSITRLPEEMGALKILKMLNLSKNLLLKSFLSNLISSWSDLEELYMTKSFSGWETEGNRTTASLVEVTSLTKLTHLDLHIEDARWLSTPISESHWENLLKFYISVSGEGGGLDAIGSYERYVSLTTRSESFPLADWVMDIVERTYALSLRDCWGIQNVLLLNPEGFVNLKSLKVTNVTTMKHVVDVKSQVPQMLFSQLEVLDICDMQQLKSIWNGPLVERSFDKLKVLKIIGCHDLVKILPSSLWARLQILERLTIHDCKNLEELLSNEIEELTGKYQGKESNGKVHLNRIKTIELWDLPNLAFLSPQSDLLLECPSLENLHIKGCDTLKKPIFCSQSTSKLQNFVTNDNEWFQRPQWEDPTVMWQLEHILTKPLEEKSLLITQDGPEEERTANMKDLIKKFNGKSTGDVYPTDQKRKSRDEVISSFGRNMKQIM